MKHDEIITKERQIVRRIYKYFKDNEFENSSDYYPFIKNVFSEVIELERQYLKDDYTLNIVYEASKSLGELRTNGHDLTINIDLSKHNFANDKESRLEECRGVIHTLFHELKHFHQTMLLYDTRVSNPNSLRLAKEDAVLFNYAGKNGEMYSGYYEHNHDEFIVETEANIYGNELSGLSSSQKKENKEENISLIASMNSSDIVLETNRFPYTTLISDRDTFFNLTFDELILVQKHKEYLDQRPILLKQYNYDCTRKTLIQLLNFMHLELIGISSIKNVSQRNRLEKELYHMYYDIINHLVINNLITEKEMDDVISTYGKDYVFNLFAKIDNYNKENYLSRKKAFYDKVSYENKTYFPSYKNNKKGVINLLNNEQNVFYSYFNSIEMPMISRDTFIKSLIDYLNITDRKVIKYFKSSFFWEMVPFTDYVVLNRNHKQMHFFDFVKKYVVNFFSKLRVKDYEDEVDIRVKYYNFLSKIIESYSINEYQFECLKEEYRYKQYKEKYSTLKQIYNSKVIN